MNDLNVETYEKDFTATYDVVTVAKNTEGTWMSFWVPHELTVNESIEKQVGYSLEVDLETDSAVMTYTRPDWGLVKLEQRISGVFNSDLLSHFMDDFECVMTDVLEL